MRKIIFLVLLACCLPLANCAQPVEQQPDTAQSITQLIEEAKCKVYPCLVRIDARKYVYSRGKKSRSGGTGSGTVIDDQGHVLTNYHVAGGATEIKCTLYNQEMVSAKLVGEDPWTDLALIKLDMEELEKKNIKLYVAELGDSQDIKVGDFVMAMGTPFGLSRSVSLGIIGNDERFLGDSMRLPDGKATGVFNNWIQTDASINPGNSGGPLVSLGGKVIGVNARAIPGASTGFAIPIDIAKEMIRKALAHPEGKVVRSWLGLQFQKTQDLERYLETGKNEGVIIKQVEKGSPASKAGVRNLDILIEINGEKVSTRFDEQLPKVRKTIADMPVGTDVKLVVLRNGRRKEFAMKTAELGASVGEDEEIKEWGITIRAITKLMAQERKLPDTHGVYVTGVKPYEKAAKAKLQGGDIITHIDKKLVEDFEAFKTMVKECIDSGKKDVVLKVRRDKAVNFILIKND